LPRLAELADEVAPLPRVLGAPTGDPDGFAAKLREVLGDHVVAVELPPIHA
jgi:hypothetical protein